MSFRTFIQRLFNPEPTDTEPTVTFPPRRSGGDPDSEPTRKQAAEWLEASEAGLLAIPHDLHDVGDWDRYWKNQVKVGPLDQSFADMMSSDPQLPVLLHSRGARTILCAGNGLSEEAIALAMFGFEVTALDISRVPAEVFAYSFDQPEDPVRQIPDVRMVDGTLQLGVAGPIDVKLCPEIHAGEYEPRAGGSLTFVTGSLFDERLSPGPFDVVIERRVLQLFPDEAERIRGLERLVARLIHTGIFVSHQHCGGWTPGQPREHYAEAWLRSRGFVMRSGRTMPVPEVRTDAPLASLMFSTG